MVKEKHFYQIKPIEELTFADDFMFGRVMQDKSICKELLEILLGIKIERIEFPEIQKELLADYKSKSIRMDVYVSAPRRNFDIELQMVYHEALPQRMRYYQSLMDVDALFKGDKYTNLKENYVIFICMFDPFGEGLPVYTFENMCREKTDLKLNDKSYKVCYNVNAFEKAANGKVKAFLKYVKTQSATDSFTHRLENIVALTKESKVFRRYYMMRNIFIDDWMDRGKAEGIAIGEERGFAQGAHEKAIETARALFTLGVVTPEQIAQATSLPIADVQKIAEEMQIN